MESAITIASKVGEYLVEPAVKQVRYLFCFNSIVEDLKGEERRLKSAQDRINQSVERAKNNAEIIEKNVEEWVADANNILTEVHGLDEEIQVNKTCLNGWCPNWGFRYWSGRKAAKKTSIMLKLIEDSNKFQPVAHPAPLPGIEFFAPQDFQLFQSSEFAFNRIIEALKNDQTNIVGLYGMGGTGKTTLAKAVGNKVNKEMFDEVVMVVISQTPNFQKIQGELAESLSLELKKESEIGRAKQLYLRFTNTQKKILVILDDVWEKFDLQQKLGIPSYLDHKGCKVLLTTRLEQVCIDMNCQQKIQLLVLETGEGLALLKKHADIGDGHPELNDVAIEIAGECGGLPLALVAIGCALKGKGKHDWKRMCRKLKEAKLEDIPHVQVSGEKGIYHCLKLSYDNLRDDNTKFCFLLCSLFPEDYTIALEDLVSYMMGLDSYDSIEDARDELLSTLDYLKNSCLLLDAGEKEFVRMHDIVRDVALWIASKGENVFMSKTDMGLTEMLEGEGWKQYTAISSMNSKIKELPNGLVCPKLKILLLGNEDIKDMLNVSDECFKEMKTLKVVDLRYVDLSLKSLQFLQNLKTLQLFDCNLRDISSLENLNKLEILSFRGSSINELPRELSKFRNLRMLDLRDCRQLKRIFSTVIQSFSHLEELYICDSFEEWEVEGTSIERGNASLFELNSLSNLAVLVLQINSKCLPKDYHFACGKLLRYDISMNTSCGFKSRTGKNALRIEDGEAASLIAFKQLYQTLEYLCLGSVDCQNILPSIDEGGLNELTSLDLMNCEDLKCITDTSHQHVTAPAQRLPKRFLEKLENICVDGSPNLCSLFPAMLVQKIQKLKNVNISSCNKLEEVFQLDGLYHSGEENLQLLTSLAKLRIRKLPQLRCIWKGPTYHVNLQSLTYVKVTECKRLTHLFTLSLAQSLGQLKTLEVDSCESLELLVIEDGDIDKGEEILSNSNHVTVVLPSLAELRIRELPQLRCIWKGPTHHVNLQSLMDVEIRSCNSLTYLFTLSLAQSLVQLKSLTISNCESLKLLVIEDGDNDKGEEILARPDDDLQCPFFSKLKFLEINLCERLEYIFPVFVAQGLVQLEELSIRYAYQLKQVFYLDGGREENTVTRAEKDIKLPELKRLRLDGLASLSRFCPENCQSSWPVLEELRINRCSNLSTSFIAELVAEVQHLEEKLRILSIGSCNELNDMVLSQLRYAFFKNLEYLIIENYRVKVIFQLEGLVSDGGKHLLSLPNLKTLWLWYLPELQVLCKGPTHALNLENLTSLWISTCDRLRHIFSPTFAPNLLQLIYLRIEDCKELEQIIFEDETFDLQPLFFPNLSEISVRRCAKLKYLFPITIAPSLQKLYKIHVEENSKLEEVFGNKEVADVMDHKEIVLPRLRHLELEALQNLTNFCHVGYHFIFSSLRRLRVVECPKMTTRFSYAQHDKFVHAEAKAPKIGNEDESAEFSPEPTKDIFCYGPQFQEKLPPYRENDSKESPSKSK